MAQTNKSRRDFLKGVAAAGAFNIIPAKVLWGAEAPSNQITRALLGFGEIAHCQYHLGYKGSRLIALCDVDERRVKDGLWCAEQAGWGRVRTCHDFREILAMPDVDVVHVCTPPHWHGCMSVMAAKAGKDVWDEKPMTRTIYEARRVRDVIKETKRMFRINTNFRVTDHRFYGLGTPVKPVKQVCGSGMLGGPLTAIVGEGQGFTLKFNWSGLVNAQPEKVPEGFDWDMWLGPAPYKPYHPYRTHATFRGYWDYDAGGLGDMAQHYLDPVQYMFGKDDETPVRVDYVGPKQHPEVVGAFDRITLTYADGTRIILDGNESLKDEPYIRGPKGAIYKVPKKGAECFRLVDANGKELDTKKVLAGLPEPKPMITDFMESVRTRKPFGLNEDKSFRSSTLVQLSAVAMRLGRGFDFDPVNFWAIDDEAANRYIKQPMREPWAKEMFGEG